MATIHLKKKHRWVDLILIGSALTLTALIIFLVSARDKDISSNDPENIALATSSDAVKAVKEKTKYNGIYIITEKSSDKNAPYTLQYPSTSSKAFNQSVTDTIHTVRDQYLKDMEKLLHKDDKLASSLTISYKTIVHKKNYYSFVLTQSLYNGIDSKQKSIKTFTYDQKNKKQILLQDVIPSQKNLTPLSQAVKKEMSKDTELKKLMKTTIIQESTQPIWTNFAKYSLSDKTFTVYYDGRALSKNIDKIKAVHIPLSSINNILAQPYKVEIKKLVKKKPTKFVALTFDDGPSDSVTPKVLKILKKHHAKATFFMVGTQVNAHPKTAKQVSNAGHEIGNHSYSHADLKRLSNAKIKSQISRTNKAIKKATGHNPTVFRPPYGSCDKRVREQTKLPVILWNVDTRDWEHRNAHKLLAYVKQYTYPGAIILMHDIHMPTANGLDAVLTYLEKEGYTFVTVSELNKMKKKK
ncbi:polysaccharide deacetylase family protein [Rummeliibacillus suwonensis]|uniref:polysaccharide deacetylase family protein n=1 Tax=Rummeliibacillus suwonensis TaxID=1306154 RepID=UPI0011B6071F|nr:polysaccharide deacetylase family protein [Rummeliibacillus suwonensis]